MTEIESLMDAHCHDKVIRVLYAATRDVLNTLRSNAEWMRGMDVGVDLEAECFDVTARSLEQNFARMMREAVAREAKVDSVDDDADDPWCVTCGHHGTDHPRGGQCGAADEERCDCQRYREPFSKAEAAKVAT